MEVRNAKRGLQNGPKAAVGHVYLVGAAVMCVLFGMSNAVCACACCADPGMRIESAKDMNEFERGEIGRLLFDETAQLFTTAAFPEDIEGILAPSVGPYRIRRGIEPTIWTFKLVDSSGSEGTIVFPLPLRLVRFEVDPRNDRARSAGGGPSLYKEWRLETTAGLTGIVGRDHNQAQATLIFHGRGNGCTRAEDFTHWTLIIFGPGVRFTLLGKLAQLE